MPNLLAAPAGTAIADEAARHILGALNADARAQAVILVPTRRAAVTMREALQNQLQGETSLLPRIIPLADIDHALLTLLGTDAPFLLETIPPAMTEWQQRYLLTTQVAAFIKGREGAATLDYALALAEELMTLQEQCARAGVALTSQKLQALFSGNMATHWRHYLDFLGILAEHWPALEQVMGLTTAAHREGLILAALAAHWSNTPPEFPLWVVGSTASQESTARLLEVIARVPNGCVILPGLDPTIAPDEWASITEGHPLSHLKHFLDRFPLTPDQIPVLNQPPTRSVWREALSGMEQMPQWGDRPLGNYAAIRLIPCAQAEAEARVIALLMREALETPGKRTALITPDEGLMTRVAAQMKRYGITIDRLERGSLATTDSGSLWTSLLTAIATPDRLLHLRSLLHHPLFSIDHQFLAQIEPYWYGVSKRRSGQLPALPDDLRRNEHYPPLEQLVRAIAQLQRQNLTASGWIATCHVLLADSKEGSAGEALEEALTALSEADMLGEMAIQDFISLCDERLSQPVRHGGIAAHPQLIMLTPVEARLQQFDRVILASMTETVWPGLTAPNAWLNLAAQASLGLPSPAHQHSLVAHDILMLGSSAEVFLTWSLRDQGSPTTRSRYIERLVTLLAMHGIEESAITGQQYAQWAEELYAADAFAPSDPIKPLPTSAQRPRRLPVTALDTVFSDPFSIYARYVLNLRELDAIDAEPEASDFGSLAHKAIQALTLHWNAHERPATQAELDAIADRALRDFADRPSTSLFWRSRLQRALRFVDGVEEGRRLAPGLKVAPEVTVEAILPLDDTEALTLHGRIDRLEEGAAGATIADYKTGEIPTPKKMLEGYATQLLAYAMLLGETTTVENVEYWRLPHGKHEGEVLSVPVADLLAKELPETLKAALRTMLDPETPFLATPGRMGHEYDGISRYDEWAG